MKGMHQPRSPDALKSLVTTEVSLKPHRIAFHFEVIVVVKATSIISFFPQATCSTHIFHALCFAALDISKIFMSPRSSHNRKSVQGDYLARKVHRLGELTATSRVVGMMLALKAALRALLFKLTDAHENNETAGLTVSTGIGNMCLEFTPLLSLHAADAHKSLSDNCCLDVNFVRCFIDGVHIFIKNLPIIVEGTKNVCSGRAVMRIRILTGRSETPLAQRVKKGFATWWFRTLVQGTNNDKNWPGRSYFAGSRIRCLVERVTFQ